MSHHITYQTPSYSGSEITRVQCPKCYLNNVQSNGVLTVNGVPHDAYKCVSCKCDFSAINNGAAALIRTIKAEPGMSEAQIGHTSGGTGGTIFSGDNVGVGANQINYGSSGVGAGQYGHMNVNISNPPPSYTHHFQNMESAMYGLQGDLSQLTLIMQGMLAEIKAIAEQNHKLMEKMASDPLVHIRKAVSEFNLI